MKTSILFAFLLLGILVGASDAQTSANGRVFWHGTIDDKAQIVISARSLEVKTIAGKPNAQGNHSFTAPLPSDSVTVQVTTKEGRSKAVVLQQPIRENNFTAIIEINDTRGGDSDYLLDIYW